MLAKCLRDQWRVDDLDWDASPRELSRDDEMAVVQYFTDMAGIERLAGALFAEQVERVSDPRLRKIFQSFVLDEERHAQVAERLARFYDVHHYERYEMNEHLQRFAPYFIDAIRHVSADIANAYITTGEILLDVALLRSLDDFVNDEMSHAAMHLIDRDESRHIAVDFHMVEYYCSEAYRQWLSDQPPKPLRERALSAWTFVNMLWRSGPFLRDVFFAPMDLTDPEGRRIHEAFKRIQLIARRDDVAARPFTRFVRSMQVLFNHPILGRVLGRIIARLIGIDPRFLVELYDEAEQRRTNRMSFQEIADEVLSLKDQVA